MENLESSSVGRSKRKTVTIIVGIVFIIVAIILAIVFSCPSKVEKLIFYVILGIGLAFLFPGSSKKSKISFIGKDFRFFFFGEIAFIAFCIIFDPMSHFKPDSCDLRLNATEVTVYVYDAKKSKQNIILRQKGRVIMDVNGARISESINDKGMAVFENLHAGDRVQINIDFSEPYHSLYKDSTYIISPNEPIYLPVVLEGIDNIHGIVLYKDSPLEGVTIGMESLKSQTDSTGYFHLKIPDSMQRKIYTVWFNKKGFKTIKATSTPETNQSLEVIMEKNSN